MNGLGLDLFITGIYNDGYLMMISSIECRFYHGIVGTEYGEVRKLERHLVNSHDIHIHIHYVKDFALAMKSLMFDTILGRLESRMSAMLLRAQEFLIIKTMFLKQLILKNPIRSNCLLNIP